MSEPAWKSLPLPEVNSRWDQPHRGSTRTVRVMDVVEGYVVARFTGSAPFLTHMSDWHLNFKPKIMPKRQRKGIEKPRADLCPGGVSPGWDECEKCGATSDESCRHSPQVTSEARQDG